MKYVLAFVLVFYSFSALANHGPRAESDSAMTVYGWCKSPEEVDMALDSIAQGQYVKFIIEGENSCIDARVSRMLGIPDAPESIAVIEILKQRVIAGKDLIVEILRARRTDGEEVFTWHAFRALGM